MRAKLRKNIGKILSDNKNCTINYIITFIKAIFSKTQNNIKYNIHTHIGCDSGINANVYIDGEFQSTHPHRV